jgi:hypothetical protein
MHIEANMTNGDLSHLYQELLEEQAAELVNF